MTKKKFRFCLIAGILSVFSAYPVSYWVLRQEKVRIKLPIGLQSWMMSRGAKGSHGAGPVAYDTLYQPLISAERRVEENRLRKGTIGTWEGTHRYANIEVRVLEVDFEKCSFEIYRNGEFMVSCDFEAFHKKLRHPHPPDFLKSSERFKDTHGNSLTLNWGEKTSCQSFLSKSNEGRRVSRRLG